MFSYPLLAFPMRIAIDSLVNVYYYKDPLRVVSTFRLILVSAIIFVLAYALAAVAIGIGVVFGKTFFTSFSTVFTNKQLVKESAERRSEI
jgi:hypothetical protein